MGFPLSFSKSRRAKQPGKGRAARFRALEERALLSAVRKGSTGTKSDADVLPGAIQPHAGAVRSRTGRTC